jgi:hypothetical protein
MIVEFGTITLYALLHDWLALGAAVVGGYKLWDYLTHFKDDIQKNATDAADKLIAANASMEKAVNFQTASIVSALSEMREDSRAALSVIAAALNNNFGQTITTTISPAHRAARAKHKKIKVDNQASV